MLYWADRGEAAKIECSWLDGQERKVLVGDGLGWPTGLSVDFTNGDRIYWSDSKESRIESVLPSGEDRRIVVYIGEDKRTSMHPKTWWRNKITMVWGLVSTYFKFVSLMVKKNILQMWETPSAWVCLRTTFIGALRRKARCSDRTNLVAEPRRSCWPLGPGLPRSLCTRSRDTTL